MTWLHPGILLTATAMATAPILIHLIHRRQMPREPWAAMQWLRAAHDTSSRKLRLQHWLLMAARIFILLLLGATVARPLTGTAAWPTGWGTARVNRVIVIDDSLSMMAVEKTSAVGSGASESQPPIRAAPNGTVIASRSVFEDARRAALSIVDASGGGDGLAVVTASTLGRTWMNRPVHDRHAVRTLIEELTCSFGTNDPSTALRRAVEILDVVPEAPAEREIYLITDLTHGAMPESPELGASDRLLVVPIGERALSNRALTGFHAVSQVIGGRIATRFAVEVTNYGPDTQTATDVEILLDGRLATTVRLGLIPQGGSAKGECEIELPRRGSVRLTASLRHDDALPIDDIRHLVVHAPGPARILLVDGRAGQPRANQDLFYYAMAACPASSSGDSEELEGHVVDPDYLDETSLIDYAVIVLGNLTRLSPATWMRLRAYVANGGGLMVFLGDRLRPDEYNAEARTDGESTSLVPYRLKDRVVFTQDADPPRLVLSDSSHVALSDVARYEKGGLSASLVHGYWTVQGAPVAGSVRTLLRLTNGHPALTVHEVERGRVATWFIGPTMADSNLPSKPDYPPLMVGITSFLVRGETAAVQHLVGDVLVADVPNASWDDVTMHRPDGGVESVKPALREGRRAWRYVSTHKPGFYRMQREDWRQDFAINVGVEDGDLRREDPRSLTTRLGSRVTILDARSRSIAGALRPPHELASLAGGLLLGLVALETLLAGRFGRQT